MVSVPGWLLRIKKPLAIFIACVAVYALVGFVILPAIIKAKLPDYVADYTGGTASLEAVRLNPFKLTLNLQQFELEENARSALSFAELHVNLDLFESLRGVLAFDEVRLKEPVIRAVIGQKGRLNWADLLKTKNSAKESEENELIPLSIARLLIQQGRFIFQDFSHRTSFQRVLFPIELKAQDFTTHLEVSSNYRLTVAEEDTRLILEGEVSVNPIRSQGSLRIENLKTRTFWAYLQDQLAFEIKKGALDLSADYRLDNSGKRMQLQMQNGNMRLNQFVLTQKDLEQALIDIPSLRMEGMDIDLLKRQVAIRSVFSKAARFNTWLSSGGTFNLVPLLSRPDAGQARQKAPKPDVQAAPWLVWIDKIEFENYAIQFEDRTVEERVRIRLAPLRMTLKNVTTKGDKSMPIALQTGVNESGRVTVEGMVGLQPVMADLNLKVAKLALNAFQPYVEKVARVNLVDGLFNLQGKLTFSQREKAEPLLSYRGNAGIEALQVTDKQEGEPLLSWQSLLMSDLRFEQAPARLKIAEAVANQPYARVIVKPDRSLNLTQVLVVSESEKASPESPGGKKSTMPVQIDAIRIENASADFADYSIQPNFSTAIYDLHGAIDGLSSAPSSRADVALEGRVEPYAPVAIKGEMNLFSPVQYADIGMRFQNVNLTALSPYSGRFVGYRIEKGKMSMDLHYQLRNKKLQAQNEIVLNQLTLGERVENPRAIDLPLRLAIALLKDRSGRIDLDLPVQGDLANPKVSFGGLIFKAFKGLLRKIVSSPFNLLGSLIGIGGEELQFIAFEAGSASLGYQQIDKLTKLAEALHERPELSLDIKGIAALERDRLALAKQDVRKQLKIAKLIRQGETVSSENIKNISLTQAEYRELLIQLYQNTFGEEPLPEQVADEPFQRMEQRLLESQSVSKTRLRLLAQERAIGVRDYLIQEEGLAPERIFMTDVKLQKSKDKQIKTQLALGAS